MTLTITLEAETEQAIERKAARLGITASEYVLRLAERAAKPRRVSKRQQTTVAIPLTGAQLLTQLKALNLPPGYGDPTIDSPELTRELRAQFSRPNRELIHSAL